MQFRPPYSDMAVQYFPAPAQQHPARDAILTPIELNAPPAPRIIPLPDGRQLRISARAHTVAVESKLSDGTWKRQPLGRPEAALLRLAYGAPLFDLTEVEAAYAKIEKVIDFMPRD